ncbi:MAG TPA: rhodanese-like domain-containing protein, partial [Thermoanaerobaculia bacterium]
MKTSIGRNRIRSLALLALIAIPAYAETRDQMLVSTRWLEQHRKTVTLLHIGDRAEYDAGHIAGARLIESSSLLVQRGEILNELPPVDALESMFRLAGVGSYGRIVVYSTDPLLATRAWFTLDYLGQGARVSLLDGGLAKWKAGGGALSQKRVVPKPGSFEARVRPEAVVHLDAMRKLVRLRDDVLPDVAFIDARPPAQFSGEEPGPGVRVAGHIPGAINLPVAMHFASDGTFRSADELRELYDGAGVSKVMNVAYCRTGM